ncbi:MAG: ABC transporter permease [Lachnospiraceae bacterium]|nr:ABC transporter permease [Ruminococcus sp.]MCM1275395.1 ABC transporter permease [Lachnospiraceae bacterium]
MKLSDMIKMCLQNLRRRKSRTLLTVLGVVVGCCAIVTMLSIGIGMQNSMELSLAEMGDLTLIQVYSSGQKAKLDDEAIKKFEKIPGVDVAIGKCSLDNVGFELSAGEKDRYVMRWANIVGFSKDGMEKFGLELVDGAYPKEQFEVLAGEFAAYNLTDTQRPDGSNMIDRWDYMYTFDPATGEVTYNEHPELPDPYLDLCGETITMQLYSYEDYDKKYEQKIKISGVVKEDYNKDYATSEGLIFTVTDLQALQKLVFPTSTKKELTYNEIYVKTHSINEVESVEEEIKKFGYSTSSMESIRKPMQEEARQQQMMLGGLGAVSLFVAALGITNTMIMSISERTREIGVMKALGCYLGNIRVTFLMEAGFIGLIGGISGSIISYFISLVINLVSQKPDLSMAESFGEWLRTVLSVMLPENSPVSIVPLWLTGFAILFSVIIGLGSGFYPANKAVHISALEAIKRE